MGLSFFEYFNALSVCFFGVNLALFLQAFEVSRVCGTSFFSGSSFEFKFLDFTFSISLAQTRFLSLTK